MARRAITFLPASTIRERDAIIASRGREAGVEPQREFKFSERVVEPTRKQIRIRQRVMRPSILAIGMNGRKRRSLGSRHGLCHFFPSHMGTEGVGGRQYPKSMSIFWIYLYGFLQQCLRD